MQPGLPIEVRLDNLRQFRQLWIEFANFVTRVARSNDVPSTMNEATYRQYLTRIAQMYPRVHVDIQRYGPQVSRMLPAGGGMYRHVPDYDPFLNLPLIYPSLADVFRTRLSVRDFNQDIAMGDTILLHSIGTLEFAQELGEEGYLPATDGSSVVFIEVLSAIRRALRPAFREPPSSEKEVQDAVELILRARAVEFEREAQLKHATKKVKPDFVLPSLDMALEVKLCNSPRREKEIIEEIGADIVAYRTRYRVLLFVVYDVATIADKEAFQRGFSNEPGVLIEIIS